jgi:hypothetical protein
MLGLFPFAGAATVAKDMTMWVKMPVLAGRSRGLLRFSFGLWIAVFAALGVTVGYGKIISMTPISLVLLYLMEDPRVGWPTGVFMAGVLTTAIWLAVRSGRQRNYRKMAIFGSLPLVGALCFFAGMELSMPLFMRMLLNDYRQQIGQARETGHDVDEKETTIHLGPPVTARFQQPDLLFNELTFIGYDETDGMAEDRNLRTGCNERSRSLGDHFYFIDSDC